MKKRIWRKPKLIILIRAKPGEWCLHSCKGGVDGPSGMFGGCAQAQVYEFGGEPFCGPERCYDMIGS